MIKRLFHLCVEKLKVLGFKKESIAGIILWGMIILGATLVNYRYILFGNSWDYGGYLVKLGEIILVSGIIGGVLRFLQSTKIIEESMISLLQNTSWISELNIENRKKLLLNSCKSLYQDMHPSFDQNKEQELINFLYKFLPSGHDYFYIDFDQVIEIESFRNGNIKTIETVQVSFLANSKMNKIKFPVTFWIAAQAEDIRDPKDVMDFTAIKFNGREYSNPISPFFDQEKGEYILKLGNEFTLKKGENRLSIKYFKKYGLENNNIKKIVLNKLAYKSTLRFINNTSLKVHFENMSNIEKYREEESDYKGERKFVCRELLFPNEGFILAINI